MESLGKFSTKFDIPRAGRWRRPKIKRAQDLGYRAKKSACAGPELVMTNSWQKMYPAQVRRDLWGFAGLSAGSSPAPKHPRGHRLIGSPHERLGGRAVDPTRPPRHLAPLGPPLNLNEGDGQGRALDFMPRGVSVPEEERAGHARGEGDPKHLPGFRGSHPLST